MIVYGTRDVTAEAVNAPIVDLAERAPLEIADGRVLQVISELSFHGFETRVPPALHPQHPPFAIISFYEAVDSPVGPFNAALVRVNSLAGISRFTYPVHGWIDNPAAADELGRRWGYSFELADVVLRTRYDRVWGTVTVDGVTVLEAGMSDPEPVSGKDANYAGHLNLARIERDGEYVPMLVQAGPQLAFTACDRGRPHVDVYADSIPGDKPYWPVSAFSGRCAFLFTPITFVCDPMVPAVEAGLKIMGALHAVEPA